MVNKDQSDRETEDRILAAAHQVFLRRGMSGARMQEIADEAGVNKALLHYYFRSKERLAGAVFRRALRQLLPRVYVILGSGDTIEGKVRGVVATEFEFLRRHPYLLGYLLAEINYHPELARELLDEVGEPPLKALALQLRAEADAGRIRPIVPRQFVANLLSLIAFPFAARPLLATLLGVGPDGYEEFLDERERALPEFFLSALRP